MRLLAIVMLLTRICLAEFAAGPAPDYTLSSSAVITNIPSFSAGVSTLLVSANQNRTNVRIFNNSGNSIYLCASLTCSSGTGLFAIVPTYQAFEFPRNNYTGPISGIRNSGTGNVVVTEFLK